ncbi:MAG: hypothetical protein ABIR46_01540 [Candidatus Saccharimonadales bacterium]
MNDLNDAVESTEGALQNIIRKIFHGDMGTLEQRSGIMAQIFEGFIDDRHKLFGEYAQLSLQSPEDKDKIRDRFLSDVGASLLESPKAFRDEIINQFYEFIATDAKIIDTIIENNRSRNSIHLSMPNPMEIAKIGAGVALGMVVARMFTRR